MQQEICGIHSADNECDECDVVYGVTLVSVLIKHVAFEHILAVQIVLKFVAS